MDSRIPHYQLIGQEISAVIRQNGIRRADLAEQIGVSLDAVNNWCLGRTRIEFGHLDRLLSVLESEGVPNDTIHELLRGYMEAYGISTNLLNRLTASGSRHGSLMGRFVVCICNDRRNETLERITNGIIDVFQRYGFNNMLTLDPFGRSELFEYCLSEMMNARPLGLILIGLPQAQASVDMVSRAFSSEHIPLVFVHRQPSQEVCSDNGVSWICPHNEQQVYRACKALLDKGHSRIAMVIQSTSYFRQQYLNGYKKALSEAEVEYDASHVIWGMDFFGFPSIQRVLNSESQHRVWELVRNREITSIVATSPVAVLQVITAMREEGQLWPEDKSIVTLGNNEWLHYLAHPPITSVVTPRIPVGQMAAELLMEMCSEFGGNSKGRGILLDSEIYLEHGNNGSIKRIGAAVG